MIKRLLIPIFLVVALIGYIIWQRVNDPSRRPEIEASGTIETTEIQVGSRVAGRIQSVDVTEGDTVKLNQPLVHFESYQLPAQVEELEAQLAQANARLQELQNGPRPQEVAAAEAQFSEAKARSNLMAAGNRSEDIAQATASLNQALSEYNDAKTNNDRFQKLYDRHVVSQQEFDTVRTRYETAQEKVAGAQQHQLEVKRGNRPQEIQAAQAQAQASYQQLSLLKSGTRIEQIAAQKALVNSFKAQRQQLQQTLLELAVKAPCPCQISSMDIKPGQLILPNQTLATLINLDDLWVRVYIPEESFGQVKVGDNVTVRVDAFPNKPFQGKVVQLASRAEFTPRNVQTKESRHIQVFGIKVALQNTDHLLHPGMPADVTFKTNLHSQNQGM